MVKIPEVVNKDSSSALDPLSEAPAQTPGMWARWIPVVAVLAISAIALNLTLRMPIGTPSTPGPGLWPLTVSLVLVLVAILLVVSRDHSGQEMWTRGARTVIGAIVSLVVFIVLFPLIGFTVPAMVMSLLWLKAFGRERWLTTALIAVITPIILYLLFDQVLGVRLPPDLLMSTILGV
ncbi:putative tricarboxylic transport membrane protein [Arthrobacter sp. CAN_A6]|uniref:tripartite tricarboxylate transporter TctB family protein n=1 Tax=Arthrobacter sp. CAN_A6 TaxID=2787721 RepID=UPI0018CA6904